MQCTVYINDMIVSVEAAKHGVNVGEEEVFGLTFADGFVGYPPEVTAKVLKCAVLACNKGNDNFCNN